MYKVPIDADIRSKFCRVKFYQAVAKERRRCVNIFLDDT